MSSKTPPQARQQQVDANREAQKQQVAQQLQQLVISQYVRSVPDAIRDMSISDDDFGNATHVMARRSYSAAETLMREAFGIPVELLDEIK